MTFHKIITLLRNRLEDRIDVQINEGFLKEAVNGGIITLCNEIDPKYLTQLRELKEHMVLTAGETPFLTKDNLGNELLGGEHAILKSQVHGKSGGSVWCNPVDVSKADAMDEALLTADNNDPVTVFEDNKIRVYPATIGTGISIHYLKAPDYLHYKMEVQPTGATAFFVTGDNSLSDTDGYYKNCKINTSYLTGSRTVTGYSGSNKRFSVSGTGPAAPATGNFYFYSTPANVNSLKGATPDLNKQFQRLIIDFAEAEYWRSDNKLDRAAAAYNNALTEMKELEKRIST